MIILEQHVGTILLIESLFSKINFFLKNITTFEDQVFVSQILCLSKHFKILHEVNYIWRNYETNSLGKLTGYLTALSCLKILFQISNFIHEQS